MDKLKVGDLFRGTDIDGWWKVKAISGARALLYNGTDYLIATTAQLIDEIGFKRIVGGSGDS